MRSYKAKHMLPKQNPLIMIQKQMQINGNRNKEKNQSVKQKAYSNKTNQVTVQATYASQVA